MALMPGVEIRLLPESRTQPIIHPTQLIFHSIVGSAEGAYGLFLNSSNLESTFLLKIGGQIIQIMDTERHADANAAANSTAGSVETEDDGHPDQFPWSAPQLASMLRIAQFYHEQHGVPLRQCRTWDDPGYGYHRLFPEWNPNSHSCPGDIRVQQFKTILLPAIMAGRWALEDDMTPEQAKMLADIKALVERSMDPTAARSLRKRMDDIEQAAIVREQAIKEELLAAVDALVLPPPELPPPELPQV